MQAPLRTSSPPQHRLNGGRVSHLNKRYHASCRGVPHGRVASMATACSTNPGSVPTWASAQDKPPNNPLQEPGSCPQAFQALTLSCRKPSPCPSPGLRKPLRVRCLGPRPHTLSCKNGTATGRALGPPPPWATRDSAWFRCCAALQINGHNGIHYGRPGVCNNTEW